MTAKGETFYKKYRQNTKGGMYFEEGNIYDLYFIGIDCRL